MASEKFDVYEIDRTIEPVTALVWLAATGARIIKFDSIGQVDISSSREGYFQFGGKISKTADILYEISFTIPVSNLNIWIEGFPTGRVGIPIFSSGPNEKIKRINFERPVRCNSYLTWCFSYDFETGADISPMFNKSVIFSDQRILHPCFTLGLLRDKNDKKNLSEFPDMPEYKIVQKVSD